MARARAEIEVWRRDYNEMRPHSALGYRPPHEVAAQAGAALHHAAGLPVAWDACA